MSWHRGVEGKTNRKAHCSEPNPAYNSFERIGCALVELKWNTKLIRFGCLYLFKISGENNELSIQSRITLNTNLNMN